MPHYTEKCNLYATQTSNLGRNFHQQKNRYIIKLPAILLHLTLIKANSATLEQFSIFVT